MTEQYLVDTDGHTIGIVLDPDTYQELIQAREELARIRSAQRANTSPAEATHQQRSIRELRGLGKEIWTGINVQTYIREERDSWDG